MAFVPTPGASPPAVYKENTYRKSERYVPFPLVLDIAPFIQHNEGATLVSAKYALKAVVVHKGPGWGGHWTTFVRVPQGWVFADDALVLPAEEGAVLGCVASTLIYERIPA